MIQTSTLVAVATGGALGSVARYGISRFVQSAGLGSSFPFGTLAANLLGCIAIGYCYIWFEERGSPVVRDFVRVGLLGGLTTFSSYCIESVALLEKHQYGWAAANILGSVVGGLIAALIGIVIARFVLAS